MKASGATALYGASLPFITPWKALVPEVEVLSLDAAPSSDWVFLMAGQDIALRAAPDPLPQGCAVLTGFARLDTATPQNLRSLAADALQALREGGLLIVGYSAEHQDPDKDAPIRPIIKPVDAAQMLEDAGFARVRVIYPPLTPDDTGPPDTRQPYIVIAQTQARGKAFDVFSPAFCTVSLPPAQARQMRAQATMQARMHQIEAGAHENVTVLHARIDVLNDRILRNEAEAAKHLAAVDSQSREIADLHKTIAVLERRTRRRGLRKLIHRLKQKRRARAQQAPDAPPAAPDVPLDRSVMQRAAPVPATPARQITMVPADPLPLSPREAQMRQRLLGQKDG